MKKMDVKKKRFIQLCCFALAIVFNIWGIMSIIHVNGWLEISFLGYLDNINHILFKYVIIVVTMSIGIMTLSITSGTLKGKLMRRLTIGVTTYSTILTIPLLLAFICFVLTSSGTSIVPFLAEMFDPIALDFQNLFGSGTLTKILFIGGILMSLVFIAVPIISAIATLRKAKQIQSA